MRIVLGIILLTGTLFLGSTFWTDPSAAGTSATELPHRRDLQRAAWETDTWLIVYQSDSEAGKRSYESLLRPLANRTLRGITLQVFDLAEVPDSLLQKYPVMLIGSTLPAVVCLAAKKLPDLGLEQTQVRVGSLELNDTQDLVQLSFLPSAWNGQLPMHLIWGKDELQIQTYLRQRLASGLRSFLWSAWGYEVTRHQQTFCMGYFNDSTWVMDKQIHFEFTPAPLLLATTPAAALHAYDGAPDISKNLAPRLAKAKKEIQDFTGADQLPVLQFFLYPTVERKALRTGSMQQVHVEADKAEVYLVSNAHFQGEEWGEQYRCWLRAALGSPAHPVLEEGLSMQWTDTIRGRPWREWAQHLAAAGVLPSAQLLFSPDTIAQYLPLIGQFAAAAWVDFRLQTIGKTAFLDEYYRSVPPIATLKQLDTQWKSWIRANYPRSDIKRRTVPQQRLNGYTLAHQGYRIYNGYGSERARMSLGVMQSIGISAVAIVPYSYLADAHRPDPIPISEQVGNENDEAVLFSHFSSKDLGQFTLLKPQIWLGGGSWPGDVSFSTPTEWNTFFDNYRRWISHYALLAELYGFDALCIGTELRYTTLQHPAAWRTLIAQIRQIYGGSLTYAANWGEECEKITFWPALDFIGVNCYYPLHQGTTATPEELAAGAQRVVEKLKTIHEQVQRPVWLTEIGYRSATAPWQNPHAEAGDRAIDEQAQAQCYAAFLAASWPSDWIKGYFWWKWPSDLNHVEDNGRGYVPLGKPAEDVLRSYYLRK
ncbi:MAG: hypothetical protein DA408_10115 [Bacteroidetes bacterium]|nr:MAG: hypothetical protein DA408_10115 [Bacteroidota bacterium]